MPSRVHAAPPLSQVPERQHEAVVHPLVVRDRQRDREVVRPPRAAVEELEPQLGHGAMRSTSPWSSTASRVAPAPSSPTSARTCEPASSHCHGRITSPWPISSTQRRPRTSTVRLSSPSTIRAAVVDVGLQRGAASHAPGGQALHPRQRLRRARSASSSSSRSARSGSASTRLMTRPHLLPRVRMSACRDGNADAQPALRGRGRTGHRDGATGATLSGNNDPRSSKSRCASSRAHRRRSRGEVDVSSIPHDPGPRRRDLVDEGASTIDLSEVDFLDSSGPRRDAGALLGRDDRDAVIGLLAGSRPSRSRAIPTCCSPTSRDAAAAALVPPGPA